jgi:hypothetical protein
MGRSLLVDGIIQLDNQTFKSYVETRYLFLFFVSLSLSLSLSFSNNLWNLIFRF